MTDRFVIDPDAVLDFAFDWSSWVAPSETITDHTITAPPGLTVQRSTVTGGVVTVWLANAVIPDTSRPYPVTCHIVTNEGRQDDRTIRVDVRER